MLGNSLRDCPDELWEAIVTKFAQCKNGAVLLEDVTIPDNSNVPARKSFTKTWRFKNTGTCPWAGFTIHYDSGKRMNAPASAPIAETAAGGTVDISLDLTAPSSDGAYTIHFSLQSATGESIAVGAQKTFYAKVIVGIGEAPPLVRSHHRLLWAHLRFPSPIKLYTANTTTAKTPDMCRNSHT